ncbi:MAG: nitrous oxide reductase family maturation protein NosD [Candidatus Kapabacteria bacterium]|nr:nitrous oxide reductase family maturation protein NosD [Candidatus Kapabacteria bacterium]
MKLINIIFCLCLINSVELIAGIIYVNPKDNSGIQTAVDKAKDGDTIIINKGVYKQNSIVIKRNLTVIGKGEAIIDGSIADGSIIYVESTKVHIKGLFFKNVKRTAIKDNAAIRLNNSEGSVIENNKILNGFFGIYLARCNDFKIFGNKIYGYSKTESSSGNGIHLFRCTTAVIKDNYIENHRDGIYLEFVSKANIMQNHSLLNLRYGLHFMFSDGCDYERNKFERNGAGVAVMYSKNVNMRNNQFHNNWGSSAYGLLLKDIRDGEIINNKFDNNTVGVYMEGSNRLDFKRNDFIKNGWALKIMGNCVDNHFNQNNFISNTFEVATNSKQSYSYFDNNYWSGYTGYDINRDGIGDVPYSPVTLFSVVSSNNPEALILLHSFFIQILEVAEKVFPSLTPETLKDKKPLMKRIND